MLFDEKKAPKSLMKKLRSEVQSFCRTKEFTATFHFILKYYGSSFSQRYFDLMETVVAFAEHLLSWERMLMV